MSVPAAERVFRCQARSRMGLQCEKTDAHRRFDETITHKAGASIWTNEQASSDDLQLAEQRFLDKATSTAGSMGQPSFQSTGESCGSQFAEQRFPDAPDPTNTMRSVLADWWVTQAETEVEATVDKAIEYSSTDLVDIGRTLARTAGREVSDEEAAELGIFFYLQGKLSRWAGAIAAGKRPSYDTIFDIGIYCRMAQRVREVGGWPGASAG